MSETLLACLQRLAGQHVAVGVSDVGSEQGLLDPEPLAVTRAISKRRTEFAAGRRAARMALTAADLPEVAIPQGRNRAPVWPTGVVGSISHDQRLAVAVVARSQSMSRLGIDIADASPFPKHLRDEILRTSAERALGGIDARLSFSAKEAVFKAFYPEVQRYFGFGAVEITPNLSGEHFTVTLREPLGSAPNASTFEGRAAIVGEHLVTILAIPA